MRPAYFTAFVLCWAGASVTAQIPGTTTIPKSSTSSIQDLLEAPIGPASLAPVDTAKILSGMRLAPPPESRSPEQLQAILASYVGRWRGDYFVRTPEGKEIARFPVEVNYVMTARDGLPVLVGVTSYTTNGKTVIDSASIWIEDGQIVSELSHGDRVEKYTARTRGSAVVWFTRDPAKSLIDYSMTETLSLTPTGGTLSIQGFEVLSGGKTPTMVFETAELKLVPGEKSTLPATVNFSVPAMSAAPPKTPAPPATQPTALPPAKAAAPAPKPSSKPPAVYENTP